MSESGTSLRELLASFGFRVDTRALDSADSSLSGLIGQAQRFGNMLLTGVVASGAARWVQGMIQVGSELHDLSDQTGLSATELTEWRYAARLAGVEAGAMQTSLARTAVMAQRQPALFRQLGVSVRGANGELRPAGDLFEDVGVALGGLSNDTQRMARATQLFGRQGRQLLPLFRQGRTGIQQLRQEVRRLYGTDLEQLADMSDRAGDAQDRFNLALNAFETRIAVGVLPYITQFLERLGAAASSFVQMTTHSNLANAALVVLGATAVSVAVSTVGAWGPPLLMFGLVAGAIAFVTLAVDDLITAFQGGRSVIGEFVDAMFGAGTTYGIVQTLREAWEGVALAVGDVWGMLTGEEREARSAQEALDRASSPGDVRTGTGVGRRYGPGGTTDGTDAMGWGSLVHGRGVGVSREDALFLGERIYAPSGGGGTTVDASRTVHVGAIHVDGSADPRSTARAVRDEIAAAGATDVDDAAHDLIPAGAGA